MDVSPKSFPFIHLFLARVCCVCVPGRVCA